MFLLQILQNNSFQFTIFHLTQIHENLLTFQHIKTQIQILQRQCILIHLKTKQTLPLNFILLNRKVLQIRILPQSENNQIKPFTFQLIMVQNKLPHYRVKFQIISQFKRPHKLNPVLRQVQNP